MGVGVGFPADCRSPKRVIFDPPGGGQKWPFLHRKSGLVHLLLPILCKNLSLIRGGPPPGGPPLGGPPGGPPRGAPPGGPPSWDLQSAGKPTPAPILTSSYGPTAL